jgi:hypothetical protein
VIFQASFFLNNFFSKELFTSFSYLLFYVKDFALREHRFADDGGMGSVKKNALKLLEEKSMGEFDQSFILYLIGYLLSIDSSATSKCPTVPLHCSSLLFVICTSNQDALLISSFSSLSLYSLFSVSVYPFPVSKRTRDQDEFTS